MKKKIWVCLLILSFVFGFMSTSPCVAENQIFPDVGNHWAKDYINQFIDLGYMAGYPDGTFKPDRIMTRAEFTSVLISCMGLTASDKTSRNFSDTTGSWAIASINEAVKRGILVPSEYPKGLVPDGGIKRSEACAMLVRALGKNPTIGITTFKDNDKVQLSDYHGYIKTVCDLGIMAGFPNGNFEPFSEMPRAQACVVLYKFLAQQGKVPANPTTPTTPTTTTPTTPPVTTVNTGSIKTLSIGNDLYDINTIPVSFIVNYQEVPVTSIVASTASINVNSSYSFNLNSSNDNPDIVVYNNRYGIDKLTVSGDKLVVTPSYRKVYKFKVGDSTYNSDYVKIYITSANQGKYLSEIGIIDEYNIIIAGQSYNLKTDKISIATTNTGSSNSKYDYYDIKKIALTQQDTIMQLVATDPVVMDLLSMSNIAAIFSGSTIVDLSGVSNIDFILGGKKYSLSEISIDATGNFGRAGEVYPYNQVYITVGTMQYKINSLTINQSKFIFYCSEGTNLEWVIVNGEYKDGTNVKFIVGSSIYNLVQAIVVGRNQVRIDGKQYQLDSSIKCQVDNKVYAISDFYYDTTIPATIIDTGAMTDSSLANQPTQLVFFENNTKSQDGTSGVTIYTTDKWLTFDQIFISDPSHFTYLNTSYALIGAIIKINDLSFTVIDTSWHGATQVLDIYLQPQ